MASAPANPPAAQGSRKIRLGELLIRAGIIDQMQLGSALAQQKQWGGRLGRHLVQMKFTDDRTISRGLAKQLGLPFLDMNKEGVDLSLLAKFPEKFATEHCCLPFRASDRSIAVVLSDPTNLSLCDEIQARMGKRIEIFVAAEHSIGELIQKAYRAVDFGEKFLAPSTGDTSVAQAQVSETSRDVSPEEIGGQGTDESASVGLRELQSRLEAFAASEEPAESPAPAAAPAPRAAPAHPAARAPAHAPAHAPAGAPQAVFYDSDPASRKCVRLLLREAGVAVREVPGLAQAFRLLQEKAPGVLILEAGARDMVAAEMCKRLKAGPPPLSAVPVLLLADGFPGWRGQQDLLELTGAEAVLGKSPTRGELLSALERVLGVEALPETPARRHARTLLAEADKSLSAGEIDQAVARLEAAVEYDESQLAAYLKLSEAYEKHEMPHAVAAALEKAALLDPGNFEIFKRLSMTYDKLGWKRLAYEAFERSARLCPNPQMKEKILAKMAKLI